MKVLRFVMPRRVSIWFRSSLSMVNPMWVFMGVCTPYICCIFCILETFKNLVEQIIQVIQEVKV